MTDSTNFTPDYLLIGHITHDVTPQGPQIGGTVSYAARTAAAFGLRVAILTSTAPGEPLLNDLPDEATVVSISAEHTTTFENRYVNGSRIQFMYHRARTLRPEMVPPAWRSARLVHLGPIAYEIDPAVAAMFGDSPICVTPQGWMRHREPDGRVSTVPWPAAVKVLPHATLTILSEEDVRHDPGLVEEFAQITPTLILTRAERGCTVFRDGRTQDFPAEQVEQVEPTGAGDIFATALHIALAQTGSLETAIRIATHLAGQSVRRIGLDGAPTPEEAAQAMAEFPNSYR